MAEEIYTTALPISGSIEAINDLYYNGHTVILVSSQFATNLQEYTDYWLDKYSVKKSGVVYTTNKSIIKGDLLVDDYDRNLLQSNILHRFLFRQPWNENNQRFVHFHDWNEITVWVNLRVRGAM